MKGRLDIIVGSMFAGKTQALMDYLYRYLDRYPGVAIRHARDTRYSDSALATHSGQRVNAVTAHDASEIPRLAGDAKCVGIDKAHFYDAGSLQAVVHRLVAVYGKRVCVAGLEYCSDGTRFSWPAMLEPDATTITHMWAPCSDCGMPATHQFCLTGKVENGGPDDFLPLCKEHFDERMRA